MPAPREEELNQKRTPKRKNKMKDHREWWCSQWTINNCLLRAYFKCIHYISFIDFRWYDGHHLSFPSNFSFVSFLLNGRLLVLCVCVCYATLFCSVMFSMLCSFFLWKRLLSNVYVLCARNRVLWMPMDVDFMENMQHFRLVARWPNQCWYKNTRE